MKICFQLFFIACVLHAYSNQESPTAAHCLQRNSQFLSQEGRKLFQSHTNLPLVKVTPVQYSKAQLLSIIPGRMLNNPPGINEAVDVDSNVETFMEDGKVCAGYEKTECARYCESHGKDD